MNNLVQRENCLSCIRYFRCSDPAKSTVHICHKFENVLSATPEKLEVAQHEALQLRTFDLEEMLANPDDEELVFSIEREFQAALDSNRTLPRDLVLGDLDLWEAPNFYEMCFDNKGLGVRPFARQLWVGLKLFGEMCPHCSDPEWYNDVMAIPVDYRSVDVPDRLQLLEYGVCPSCGSGRAEMFNAGDLPIFMELGMSIGQRAGKCAKFDTLVLTGDGIKQIGDMRPPNAGYGFTPLSATLSDLNGDPVHAGKYYVNKPEMLYTVTLSDGKRLTGTADHPLYTINGFVKIRDLTPGDSLPITVGQNLWGTAIPSAKKAAKKARWRRKNIHRYPNANYRRYHDGDLTTDMARVLGYYVAEGMGGKLNKIFFSNRDPDVLVYVHEVMETMLGGKAVLGEIGVWANSVGDYEYFLELLGSNGYSSERHVPPCIMAAPVEYVIAFLQGYFEGDGGWDKNDVFCGSISERLIREISVMLGNLGIVHSVRYRGSYENRFDTQHVWEIHITGYAIDDFMEIIGFQSPRKIDAIAEITARRDERAQANPYAADVFPVSYRNRFRELLRSVGSDLSKARFADRKGTMRFGGLNTVWDRNHGMRRIFHDDTNLTRNRVLAMCDDLLPFKGHLSEATVNEVRFFRARAKDVSTYFAQVVSVEEYGVEESYDFEVDGVHRFMAEGILNHNSISVSMFITYHLHKLLSMVRPAEFYGQTKSTTLSHTYTALQLNRAIALLWTPIKAMMEDSPWFQSYFSEMRDRGARLGEELVVVKDTYINFRRARLMARPVSPNRGTLRGDTRCIVGSALVNTNKGLLRLDRLALTHAADGEDALFANMRGLICDWIPKGVKSVIRVFLENGQSLEMTPDHKILARTDEGLRWINAEDALGQSIIVSLADSGFPEKDGMLWVNEASLRYMDPEFFLSCSRDMALRYLRCFVYGVCTQETHVILHGHDYRNLQQILLRFGYLSHYDALAGKLFVTEEDSECLLGEWAQLGLLESRGYEEELSLAKLLTRDSSGPSALRAPRMEYWRKGQMAAIRCTAVSGTGSAPVFDITVDHPKHAFSANGIVVKNCGGAIDELGWFKVGDGADEAVTISADETYASIANSLTTVRTAANRLLEVGENAAQQGIMFNVSSPKSAFDKITTLVRKNRDSKLVLALNLPTWEYNPQVTRADLQIYFDNDPIKAERDYGANPPLSSACFFENHAAIKAMFKGPRNRIVYRRIERVLDGGKVEAAAVIESLRLPAVLEPAILSIDAGWTNNSFALTLMSQPTEQMKQMATARGLKLRGVIHGQVEIIPPKVGRVNHKRVLRSVILRLIKDFNVQAVIADRWQSILLMDMLRDGDETEGLEPVHVEMYSLRMNDFIAIKSYCEGGSFLFPKPETPSFDPTELDVDNYPYCMEGRPSDHCMTQFCTVVDTGRTVDKGEGFTDDLFRSFAVGAKFLLDEEWVRTVLKAKKKSGMGGGLGAIASGSVGASSIAGANGKALVATGGGSSSPSGNVFALSRK